MIGSTEMSKYLLFNYLQFRGKYTELFQSDFSLS